MQAIATTDAEALMTVAADADLSEIIRVGRMTPSKLTEAEAFRYEWFMRQFWLSFQNIYQQGKLGLIDPSVWQSYLSVVCGMWTLPGTRETWHKHAGILEEDFISTVQACGTEYRSE